MSRASRGSRDSHSRPRLQAARATDSKDGVRGYRRAQQVQHPGNVVVQAEQAGLIEHPGGEAGVRPALVLQPVEPGGEAVGHRQRDR